MAKTLLTNVSQSTFVFTLYHDVYCAATDECDCKSDDVLRSVVGGLQYQKVMSPVGVYLEPGEDREFASAVVSIPQVEEARKRGILQVKTIEVEGNS